MRLQPGMLHMPPGAGEHSLGDVLPIAPLVRTLAERLDQAGVSWAVLRNAEGLPEFTRYDLDLLTLPRHEPAFISSLLACAAETGWRVAGQIRKRHYTCILLMRGSSAEGVFFLPVDIFTALEFRGVRYLDAPTVLRERTRTGKGIWTIPPGTDAAITLLKELFPHGVLKENSRTAVQAHARIDREGFRRALAGPAGDELGERLAAAVCEGSWSRLPSLARDLRRAARRRSPGWPAAYVQAGMANVRHLFRPALGCVVCLAGADGSGKTTLAAGLAERMFKRPFKACRYVHGNVGVLPRFRDIRAFLRRLVTGASPLPAPEPAVLKGMMPPIPAWKSMALSAYYGFDLLLARPGLRRWRGQWNLVIMDRSFYDYYYQLGHRRCPRWWLDGLALLLPKPDLLLCIEGDAASIHARKPELTVEEIRAEQAILRGLVERFSFGRRVDGTAGVPAMVDAARRETLHRLLGDSAS